MENLLLKFVSTELLKKVLISIAGVLVKKTDTKFDDEIYEAIAGAINE